MEQNYNFIYKELLDSIYQISLITIHISIYKNSQTILLNVKFNLEKDFNDFSFMMEQKNIYFNYLLCDGIDIALYYKHIPNNYLKIFEFLSQLKFPQNVNSIRLLTEFDKNIDEFMDIVESLRKKYAYDYIKLNFPNNLIELIIEGHNIYNVDNLPTNLKLLNLSKTSIKNSLDWLPSSLETLYLNDTILKLFRLENLPSSLKSIYVDNLFFDSVCKFNEWIIKSNMNK